MKVRDLFEKLKIIRWISRKWGRVLWGLTKHCVSAPLRHPLWVKNTRGLWVRCGLYYLASKNSMQWTSHMGAASKTLYFKVARNWNSTWVKYPTMPLHPSPIMFRDGGRNNCGRYGELEQCIAWGSNQNTTRRDGRKEQEEKEEAARVKNFQTCMHKGFVDMSGSTSLSVDRFRPLLHLVPCIRLHLEQN